MTNIRRVHPGIFIKESLEALEITLNTFTEKTGITENTLVSIINGNSGITYDVAYKLSQYFNNSINYWLNLQQQYDHYLNKKSTN